MRRFGPRMEDVFARRDEARELLSLVDDAEARMRMIASFGHTGREVSLRIREENLKKDCCVASFLRGVFLVCGTVTDPHKEYHLEFSTPHLHLAEDLAALLNKRFG